MLDCISVSNMRQSDAQTIEKYVPSRTLMYRAAMGVFLAVERWQGRITIAVGSGNNGGDGYALAYILKRRGIDSRVVTLSDKRSDDGAFFAEKALALGVKVSPYTPGCFTGSDIIVDCLLGTGFQGAVRQSYADAIREINGSGACVVSVDINSGMNGDTGLAAIAVRSDLTVTIGYVKNGLVAPEARPWIGRLVCADIGIVLDREENKLLARSEWNDRYAHRENCFLAPDYLDVRPIDAAGFDLA
ncbi:MAG: NAD(P)H-hydrate epimerase [Oscillospiraceae bacterium]|nr:NAD(P)H-hydrate epimerase [Oscillospiraceae bacterium]